MKKIQMVVLGLTFSLLVLSCFALERIGVAQVVPEGDLGCQDIPGCKMNMTCGSKGTVNNCHITCANGGTVVCPVY